MKCGFFLTDLPYQRVSVLKPGTLQWREYQDFLQEELYQGNQPNTVLESPLFKQQLALLLEGYLSRLQFPAGPFQIGEEALSGAKVFTLYFKQFLLNGTMPAIPEIKGALEKSLFILTKMSPSIREYYLLQWVEEQTGLASACALGSSLRVFDISAQLEASYTGGIVSMVEQIRAQVIDELAVELLVLRRYIYGLVMTDEEPDEREAEANERVEAEHWIGVEHEIHYRPVVKHLLNGALFAQEGQEPRQLNFPVDILSDPYALQISLNMLNPADEEDLLAEFVEDGKLPVGNYREWALLKWGQSFSFQRIIEALGGIINQKLEVLRPLIGEYKQPLQRDQAWDEYSEKALDYTRALNKRKEIKNQIERELLTLFQEAGYHLAGGVDELFQVNYQEESESIVTETYSFDVRKFLQGLEVKLVRLLMNQGLVTWQAPKNFEEFSEMVQGVPRSPVSLSIYAHYLSQDPVIRLLLDSEIFTPPGSQVASEFLMILSYHPDRYPVLCTQYGPFGERLAELFFLLCLYSTDSEVQIRLKGMCLQAPKIFLKAMAALFCDRNQLDNFLSSAPEAGWALIWGMLKEMPPSLSKEISEILNKLHQAIIEADPISQSLWSSCLKLLCRDQAIEAVLTEQGFGLEVETLLEQPMMLPEEKSHLSRRILVHFLTGYLSNGIRFDEKEQGQWLSFLKRVPSLEVALREKQFFFEVVITAASSEEAKDWITLECLDNLAEQYEGLISGAGLIQAFRALGRVESPEESESESNKSTMEAMGDELGELDIEELESQARITSSDEEDEEEDKETSAAKRPRWN